MAERKLSFVIDFMVPTGVGIVIGLLWASVEALGRIAHATELLAGIK